MLKNKLNNYFVLEILKSYFFVLAILTLLLWITQSARLVSLVTESGMSIKVYIEYIFFLIPKVISQVILISFLISLFINIIKFQTNKEIEIYWLSGISKKKIIKIIFNISLLITLFGFFFYTYLVPASSLTARNILGNSEFSLINTIIKKNNFNSPFKDLTIFVHKNDNKGNLEKIYIFETDKTIISKKGRVLNINNKNYLELTDGVIHEKNNINNITTINFQKTIYDFTKYNLNIVITPKLQELNFFSILEQYKIENNKNILYEIHKRLFKPLFIPIIGLLCCFILYNNNEKINVTKIKIIIFSLTTIFILLIEVLLNLSTINLFFKYTLYSFPFFGSILIYYCLIKFLGSETKSS